MIIETAQSSGQIAEFVDIAFQINKENSLWVPALRKQDIALLTPGKHPFWQTAKRELFIARENGKSIGRIAAIIDEKYNEYAGVACGAFGFFECINDQVAAHALLDKARQWLRERGMEFMRGPLNPSTNYTCGLLVAGFEYAPVIMMPWNPPYYAELLESWHMRKEQDLFAYLIDRDSMDVSKLPMEEINNLKEKNMFTCRAASKKTLKQDIHAMLDIYKKSWANNWGFSPLSHAEADELVKELLGIVDTEFFTLFFHKETPVAGMVALPDMNPLLKRLDGKIGISIPWHYWQCRQAIRRGYRIMLFGILPEYRIYGLPLLLLDYMLDKARSRPELEWVEGSWVLEDNRAIDDLIEDFGGRISKRYRIYRREIAKC